MTYCAIKICRNYKKKKNRSCGNISYHVFPKDTTIKEKWIAVTGRGDSWSPPQSCTICSDHFDDTCYVECSGRRYLKRGSIPSLNLQEISQKIIIAPNESDAEIASTIEKLKREKEYYKQLAERRKKIIMAAQQRNRRLLKKMKSQQVLLRSMNKRIKQ